MKIKKASAGRVLWLLAAILWMALIFHFSGQKASQSSEVSGSITYRMAKAANHLFDLGWDGETLERYAGALEHPVRKAAHMTEYAVLAWLFLGNFMQYPFFRKRAYLWAGGLAAVYASTDEFHQLFIEGRSGEWKDVAIDSLGAILGLLFVWAVCLIWNHHKKERGEGNGRI